MNAFISYLVSGIAFGCAFALLGAGFVAIHRVTHVVNFAQGLLVVVGGLVAHSLVSRGVVHGAAEFLAVAAAAACGLLIGLLALARRGTSTVGAMVVTLGLAISAYAVEIAIWGDLPVSFTMLSGSTHIAGASIQTQYFLIIGVSAAVFVALIWFFGHTYLGKGFIACASNSYAAKLVGIKPLRMGLLAFLIGGVLGGVAGVLLAPVQPMSFNSDVELAINGFAAAIFGGLNHPGGALAGGLILGIVESFVAGYVSGSDAVVAALALMVGVMIWQSRNRPALAEESA